MRRLPPGILFPFDAKPQVIATRGSELSVLRRSGGKIGDALEPWCDDLMIAVGFWVRKNKQ